MPYISPKDRPLFNKIIEDFIDGQIYDPFTPGELNYLITTLLHEWSKNIKGYTAYNTIIGILECAKQEFYRRIVAPYEDEKILENGDVF